MACAWLHHRSEERSAALVSYLLKPVPAARMGLDDGQGSSEDPGRVSLGRQELRTGRPELPVLVAERWRSVDGSKELLWLRDARLPAAQSWFTVVPVAARRPGLCAADRQLEIRGGNVQIRSTTRPKDRNPACEAQVAPEGAFGLEPFLFRPLSQFSVHHALPAWVEQLWMQEWERRALTAPDSTRPDEPPRPEVALVDLDLDGELEWLIRDDRTIDVISPTGERLGVLEGTEVAVRSSRHRLLRDLEVRGGKGTGADKPRLYKAFRSTYEEVAFEPSPSD